MSGMPDSLPYWIAGALVLFWFVGAYNRLVRLRSAALQAYAALDAALVRQLDFVRTRAAQEQAQAPVSSDPAPEAAHSGTALQAAAGQLATLLAATRLQPLSPARLAALDTALHVMLAAWQHLHPDAVISFDADGTLSRPASLMDRDRGEPASIHQNATVPIAWPEPSAAAEIARSQFNLAVAQYNAAVTQFPALLVAWIMQLRQAAPLR
jgi:hypothetical protein